MSCILDNIFLLFCTRNRIRFISEVSSLFSDYFMFNYFDKFNVGLSSIIAIYCSDFYSTFVHFKTQSKLIFSFLFIGGTSLGLFLVWSNYYDVDIAILITLLYIVSLFIIALLCFSPTVFASSTSSFSNSKLLSFI